jgi:hypothetical protein
MVEVKEKTNVVTGLGLLGMSLDIAVPQQAFPEIVPIYNPKEIVYGGKRYVLREPLQCECEFTPDGGNDTFFIRYRPFLIWGAGYTMEEAVDFFNFQFATTYNLLNKDGEDKLCGVYKDILKAMNKLVTNVVSW